MVKHIQTIRRQQPKNCLSVFDPFMGLLLKGLTGHNLAERNFFFIYHKKQEDFKRQTSYFVVTTNTIDKNFSFQIKNIIRIHTK